MRNLGLEVLQEFVDAAECVNESHIHGYRHFRVLHKDRVGTPAQDRTGTPAHGRTEARKAYMHAWNRSPEAKARSRARAAIQRAKKGAKTRMPKPPKSQVEIFWGGQDWYYASPHSSVLLGGPFDSPHEAWSHADKANYEVVDLSKTRGNRKL